MEFRTDGLHPRATAFRPPVPDARGRFGQFGGRFVPETLMFALEQLTAAYESAKNDPVFQDEFRRTLADYVGRPSRLYFAERLTREKPAGPASS